MTRTLITDLHDHIDKQVSLEGFVDVRRDHGKLIFLDLRDRSGCVQVVALPNHAEAHEVADTVRGEWVVRIEGVVNKRPEKMVKAEEPLGDVEIEATAITVLSRADELPFEIGTELNIDTHLDHLPIALRSRKWRSVFSVQAAVASAFRDFYRTEGFTEIQAPKLIGDDAEGGANAFELEYFGHTARLAQSPQLYKQMMVGVFERVFTVGNVFRAEKHATSRHLNEYTSLDIEMGFINDHTDVMDATTDFLRHLSAYLSEHCTDEFAQWDATIPTVPEKIPAMTLTEAQEVITKETGKDCIGEPDLEPEHERFLCEYAAEKYDCDFIFITHFPTEKRPFYTYRDEEDPRYTKGFDLLFRGVEIVTGAQRIHDYDQLVASMKEKGLNPERFAYYLQAFKWGLPPHGGIGMGLERLTAKLLGIENVKLATLFPRDLNRIDKLLNE